MPTSDILISNLVDYFTTASCLSSLSHFLIIIIIVIIIVTIIISFFLTGNEGPRTGSRQNTTHGKNCHIGLYPN